MTLHDPRLTAARGDIADRRLEGTVAAKVFVDGRTLACVAGKTAIRRRPSADAPVETELLYGEAFAVFETAGGFCWGQSGHDGYVGYVEAGALARPGAAPTHRVTASSTFVYAEPNLKSQVLKTLPFNAKVAIGQGDYAPIPGGGFVFARHFAPLGATAGDWVAVASRFVGTPYLWGGRTPLGYDCSGLIQSALEAAGVAVLRDTDMQERSIGNPIAIPETLQGLTRGDMIFWKGHVGVMQDAVTLLHANAHHMTVAAEPLHKAVVRILAKGAGPITSVRRLPS
ncbi:MAG: C40 family peptidase [Alphaproteobacteria bacterium]|nr:C40 family peptidase [Alphaproteobacteria bacterium]